MARRDRDRKRPQSSTNSFPTKDELAELFVEIDTVGTYDPIRLNQALLAERYIEGDQWIGIALGQIENLPWPNDIPQASRNVIRPMVLTMAAQLTEDRPAVKAYPKDALTATVEQAAAANALIEYVWTEQDLDALFFRAAMLAYAHGSVYLKSTWDIDAGTKAGNPVLDALGNPVVSPTKQYKLENVGAPSGDALIELLTIFQVRTSGEEFVEDATWVLEDHYVDKYVARQLCVDNNVEDKDIPALTSADQEITFLDGVKRTDVVRVSELWWRPSARFPKGLYALYMKSTCISVQPYPYKSGKLPYVGWKIFDRRNSPYGSTPVDDVISMQRQYNVFSSAQVKQALDMAGVKLLAVSSIYDRLREGNQIIEVASVSEMEGMKYVSPPPLATLVTEASDRLYDEMNIVLGVNPVTTGAQELKAGTSGTALAYAKKMDQQKASGTSRNLQKAIRLLMQNVLSLYQQYATNARILSILGRDGQVKTALFRAADLNGIDVLLQPASAVDMYRESAGIREQQQATLPPDVVQKTNTGLATTSAQAEAQQKIQGIIGAVRSGQQVAADPKIDPAIAVQAIDAAMQLADGPIAASLAQLKAQYEQLAAQQMQQMQQTPQQGG